MTFSAPLIYNNDGVREGRSFNLPSVGNNVLQTLNLGGEEGEEEFDWLLPRTPYIKSCYLCSCLVWKKNIENRIKKYMLVVKEGLTLAAYVNT